MDTFRIEIAQTDVDDLHARLARTRWPGDGWGRGIGLAEVRELAGYWRSGYDWRAAERRLNELPQFVTEIDGQRVHFAHVRSSARDAKALMLTHGFPSSFAEFEELITLLPDFHLVVPSLPGYTFSAPLAGPGWTMARMAGAWKTLMERLGYDRYGLHGGDVGAGVSGAVAGIDGDHVIGVHVCTDPVTAAATATFIPGMADRLDPDDPLDKLIRERMDAFTHEDSGYLAIQNTRPQTIGYGLTDSPVLQLAWIAEKFAEWTERLVDRDRLLTNVSLYWHTASGVTAAHTLYEQAHSTDWGSPPAVPQAFAVFGADDTVRKLIPTPPGTRWTEFAHGRHFPALEAPADLAEDLREFFRELD
ncbi:epoxide hydrolase family protein [Actinoplanes sp. CA-131856]